MRLTHKRPGRYSWLVWISTSSGACLVYLDDTRTRESAHIRRVPLGGEARNFIYGNEPLYHILLPMINKRECKAL